MSQHSHIATFANRRESAMTVFARPEAVDIAAIDAVRCGRQLSEAWLQTEVENTAALDPLLHETLSRLSEGEVFSKADDHTIVLMLAAVRQTLDGFRPNYGDFFLRENTGQDPFFDIEQDRVRRLGELLKGFIQARYSVIDAIVAERQIRMMRRW